MIGPLATPASIVPALLRRKALILISGMLTALLAFGVSRVLPLQYVSEGNLIIEHPSSDDPKSPTVLNSILTQVDVLQSSGLIRRSIGELGDPISESLAPAIRLPVQLGDYLNSIKDEAARFLRSEEEPKADPETEQTTYIQKHLKVEAKENSSVISVKFEAGAPATAAAVVNALMSTYIATINSGRDAASVKADQWVSQQIAANWREVEAAEQRVMQFMRENPNLAEVQGAPTENIQLSKDKGQLALAREELARYEASLDTISRSGAAAAEETLSSRSIQALKELEAKTLDQLSSLTDYDPRRASIQSRLATIRSQIKNESALIVTSLSRNVQVVRARVHALEAAVQAGSRTAQASTVATTTLKQLTSDLEAKRQLYVEFLKSSGQARLAAIRAPSARILFQAVPPRQPAQSFGMISLILGFIGGVVGASGVVVLRSALSGKITSTGEVADVTGLPVVGSLPDLKLPKGGAALVPQNSSLVVETFRGIFLATRQTQDAGKTILVTSSEINEGKTTIATLLARSLADDGFQVLLIDADLRRPQVAKTLRLRADHYVESVLTGASTLDKAVVADQRPGLACLLANGTSRNPIRSLSSNQFRDLVTNGTSAYEYVIIDSAPVLHVADAVLLAGLCDRILFVVEAGRVARDLVAEATRRFAEEDRPKIFTLLTRVRATDMDRRDYYSGYARAH